MTALDDALNSSSIQYGPHQLRAYWRESDRTVDGDANPDTPTNLTIQSDGTYTISHGLNDALPDPVTMTGDGDASGVLKAGVGGRPGLVLGTSGNRAYDGGGGSWDSAAAATTLSVPIPIGTQRDDFMIAAILISDPTASLAPDMDDPKDLWQYLGVVTESTLAMHLYAKRRWRNQIWQPLTLVADKPVSYMSFTIGFWARNPNSIPMDYRIADVVLEPETSSTTTHSVSSKLTNKGYQVVFWGVTSASGAVTHTAPMVLHGTPSANGVAISGGIRPLSDAGTYTAQMTQGGANAVVCKAAISIEPFERPFMTATRYFSPFEVDSPIYGWDRDTADVQMDARVLTETGPVDTRLFTGQMQGVPVKGRAAQLDAVSKTRISLNRSLVLPMVSGVRENCLIDWLVTYLMARGGSFVGPAPNRYTRYWAPLYGSLHAHWDTPQSYNAAYLRDTTNPFLLFGIRNPRMLEGPFMAAMWGQQTATRCEEIALFPKNMHQMTRDDFPHLYDNGATGPVMADMMSLSNSKGRLQIWVRGDAAQSAPTYMVSDDDFLVQATISMSDGGVNVGYVECGVASNSRNPYIRMGTQAAGTLSTSFVFSGLPTDGQWHFYGFWWDFAAGTANVCFDGSVITASGWTGVYNDTSAFPSTDAVGRANGLGTSVSIKSHLPASDIILDFGETYTAGQWTRFYPTPEAPGDNAVYRATYVKLNAIAEASAVNAWDTLGDLCRSVMASYRCDEQDVFNFLPLEWFGLTPQMTPVAVQDTETNAGELDLIIDPSKIRNVVTLKFPDTRVDTQPQFVLRMTSSVPIPKGVSEVTFPLDTPVVEIHGQASQAGATWNIVNLTSSQITTPNLPKQNHFITVNTGEDGGGTVLAAGSVTAKIVAWDAGSVTLQFKNMTANTTYLANNGDQVPFLQILGYGARASDAYTTARDEASVALRRERALEAEMPWLQTRTDAVVYAHHMVNNLTHQTPLVQVNVVGNPLRKPGQLVTMTDAQGTRVSGTWRVLTVEHNIDGPEYTQDLLLKWVGPFANWDDPLTPWDIGVWSQ